MINPWYVKYIITDYFEVRDFLVDTVKPYKAGNYALWALDDLNIQDKHQLIIPVLKLMLIDDFRLEDDSCELVDLKYSFIADEPWRIRLKETYGRNLIVKDKGHATPWIFFDLGFPFEGQSVIPALNGIAEEVTRTVETFEICLG
jgi:hypothetical protein